MDEPKPDRSLGSQVGSAAVLSHSRNRGQVLYLCENLELANLETVAELQGAGFKVTPMDAREYPTKCWPPASGCLLILFDIHEPDDICYQLCERIRAQWTGPIMAVLQGDPRLDTLHGFEVGCDMQIRAPIYVPELVARVNALMRGYYRKLS